MWNELKEDLINLPLIIKNKEIELYQKKAKLEEYTLQQKSIKNIVSQDVYNSKKDGKNEFTNERTREFEIIKRLDHGTDFQKLSKNIEIIKELIITEQINLEYLKRRFRAVEGLTRM